MAVAVTLVGLLRAGPLRAQSSEHWEAIRPMTRSITGNVTFAPDRITFETGDYLDIQRAGPLPNFIGYGRPVRATLYRVVMPQDLTLLQGNRLCGGRAVTYLVTWQPALTGDEPNTLALAAFSGDATPTSDSGLNACGTFTYQVSGRH